MKPKNWYDCPNSILSDILWNVNLYYCDSSREEAIHTILCEPSGSDSNDREIQQYWDNISEEKFENLVNDKINELDSTIKYLRNFL